MVEIRVPNQTEINNCKAWLDADFKLLEPELVIAVGKLAIQQFVSFDKLARGGGADIH